MRRFARPLVAALLGAGAMLASAGSIAEIYKWVDQKGVTNYSNTPPATGKARTLDPDAVSVSIYPAPSPQDPAQAREGMMRQRIARLENELHEQRRAQQASYQSDSDLARLAYEQCARERRVDCDTSRDGVPASPRYYTVAAPVYVVARPMALRAPFPATRLAPASATMRAFQSRGVRHPAHLQHPRQHR